MHISKQIRKECLKENRNFNETVDVYELFAVSTKYDEDRECVLYEFEDHSVAVMFEDEEMAFSSKKEFYQYYNKLQEDAVE